MVDSTLSYHIIISEKKANMTLILLHEREIFGEKLDQKWWTSSSAVQGDQLQSSCGAHIVWGEDMGR